MASFRSLGDATNINTTLQLPGGAVSNATDLWSPLQSLLVGLNVLPTDDDLTNAGKPGSVFGGPAQSVAILEAGATAASKAWATLAGALGGGTAIWAAVTNLWNGQKGGERIALLGSAAFVLAACVIGIAIVVSSDVRSRALGAAAIYDARRSIAIEFIRSSISAHCCEQVPKTAAAVNIAEFAYGHVRARVQLREDGRTGTLTGIRDTLQGVEVQFTPDDQAVAPSWHKPADLQVSDGTY